MIIPSGQDSNHYHTRDANSEIMINNHRVRNPRLLICQPEMDVQFVFILNASSHNLLFYFQHEDIDSSWDSTIIGTFRHNAYSSVKNPGKCPVLILCPPFPAGILITLRERYGAEL